MGQSTMKRQETEVLVGLLKRLCDASGVDFSEYVENNALDIHKLLAERPYLLDGKTKMQLKEIIK